MLARLGWGRGTGFLRLDGSTKVAERQALIESMQAELEAKQEEFRQVLADFPAAGAGVGTAPVPFLRTRGKSVICARNTYDHALHKTRLQTRRAGGGGGGGGGGGSSRGPQRSIKKMLQARKAAAAAGGGSS